MEPLEDRRLLAIDFGDAPIPYSTLLSDDGARHEILGPRLGTLVDAEVDGQPSLLADGDDFAGIDDEDGVTFGTIQVGQLDATVTVNVANAPSGAKLDAWIDFNHDGSWGGPQERTAANVAVTAGSNTIHFDIPGWTVPGNTFARFRLSTAGELGPGGPAPDGEVEDYQISIQPATAVPGLFAEPKLISDPGQLSVFPTDLDGDGDTDILCTLAPDMLAWQENDGTGSFTTHLISERAPATALYAVDVDGDGDTDILSAERSNDTIAWYENDGSEVFTRHVIATLTGAPSSIFGSDVDGDGDTDVVATAFLGGSLVWYENDGNEVFLSHIVTNSLTEPRCVFVTDLDRDGDMDMLSGVSHGGDLAWYENDGSQIFTTRVISTSVHLLISSIFASDVDGDGDTDVLTTSPSIVPDRVDWFENDGNQVFTRLEITGSSSATDDPKWVRTGDMDGDGDMDVLVASSGNTTIAWYENLGTSYFPKHWISRSAGLVAFVFAADIDGDGDLDVASNTNTWYENDGNGVFSDNPIATSLAQPRSVFAADMDGDGGEDVLTASYLDDKIAWFENDGDGEFLGHTITTDVDGANFVRAADLDGDGDLDVLSGYRWFENDGNRQFQAREIVPGSIYSGRNYAVDMDNDGDMDLAALDVTDGVAWFENDGDENFELHRQYVSGVRAKDVADIDGDGDLDLVANDGSKGLGWLENDGEQSFAFHPIIAYRVDTASAVDIDGDGDMDILVNSDYEIAWYENDGMESFTRRVLVTGFDWSNEVLAADIDGDGDMDVLSELVYVSESSDIVWFKNNGSGAFVTQEIAESDANLHSLFAADVDSDGDLDILSASFVDGVAWYENVSPGFTVAESDDTTSVSETGTTDSFTVVLDAPPASDVVVTVTIGDTSEATVAPVTLTFTPDNWNTPQIVTVIGVDDAIVDGNQLTTITLAIDDATSDNAFDALADKTVLVTTTDNDTAGFTVTETSGGTSVSESGTTDTFSVVLNAAPLSNVLITVTSGDTGEGVVAPATLTFTPANWNQAQTVTITGVDDAIVDGNQFTTITLSIDDANSDNAFDALADKAVLVTTTDNDTAGFSVTETSGSTSVSESGSIDTFEVVLTAAPLTSVVITVASGDMGEAAAAPATLTFTPANWSTPQLVTVTGVDDVIVDGNQLTTITLAIDDANSDNAFDSLADKTVLVTTVDDDTAGFSVTEKSGSTSVSESGTTDTFEVVLNAAPLTNVVIAVSSGDTGEATVAPATLTFTPANWNQAQTVTVTGVDDVIVDGSQVTTITLSIDDANSDNAFDSLADKTVLVTTTDNDTAGFTVTESSGSTSISESGTTDTFSVVLNAAPLADVVITVTNGDAGEATVAPAALTFTPANWNQAQTVTVTGINDTLVDGNQTTTITLSIDDANSDNAFDALADQTVLVTTTDNDTAGFTVTESSGSTSVSESGTTDTFSVVLNAAPLTSVMITVTGSDTGEATVAPATLTFTPANWNQAQTVTATGVNDTLVDGNQTTTITLSIDDTASDNAFDALADKTVLVTTVDDDTAGFTVTETSGSTSVSESGATDTFEVVLTAAPLTSVVITVTSGDTGEITVAPATLTFTPANWNQAQTVTVTGVDDAIVDGNQFTTITLAIDDANSDNAFDALADKTVLVTTSDNDTAGFTVTESSGGTSVSESGTTDTFSVVLNAAPLTSVVITVTSGDTGEGVVAPATLTLTPGNWNAPQTVTITGVDDSDVDSDQTTTITLSIDDANSDDDFDSLADQLVNVTNRDNDSIVVTTLDDELDADLNDPDDVSLREALSLAANDVLHPGADIITFSPILGLDVTPGCITLSHGQLMVNSGVVIQGPGASQLTIGADTDGNGEGESRIFYIGPGVTAALNGLSMTGGYTSYSGGAVFNDGAVVTIADSIVSGNLAPEGNGGGIYSEGGQLTLNGTTIAGNAAQAGGGIASKAGALFICQSAIFENTAENTGGGVHGESGTLAVDHSTISGNVGPLGGGVYNLTGELTISHSTIADNSGTTGGGLLTNGEGIVRVSDSNISGNVATYGGGVCSTGASLFVSDSTISTNVAQHSGGGIHSNKGTLIIASSTIRGNSASTGNGGGVFTGLTDTVTISNSVIAGNVAVSAGGLFTNSGQVNVANSTIAGNLASSEGGGIYNNQTATLTITNSIVSFNVDASGGQIFSCTSIQGGHNLIGADPRFVQSPGSGIDEVWGTADDVQGDYRLTELSPAVDAGTNLYLDEIDCDGTGPDQQFDLDGSGSIGDYAIGSDLAGQPRVQGDRADLGAYEYQGPAAIGRETPAAMVTTLADTVDLYDGLVSLREAIYYHGTQAITDPIVFQTSLGGGRITLAGSSLVIDTSLQIDASSLASLAIDGNERVRVLTVLADQVDLHSLNIENGDLPSFFGPGGGIYNASGSLTITNSTIAYNRGGFGGGIDNWSGILTLSGCEIRQNAAGIHGGGLYNGKGTVLLTDCVLSGNSSQNDGGGMASESVTGAVTVLNTYFLGNSARYGGGIMNSGGPLFIAGSAIVGNLATVEGGGIRNSAGTMAIASSTIAENEAGSLGGGIQAGNAEYSYNTIVAGNLAPSGVDIAGQIDGGYNNLIGDGTDMTGLTDGVDGNRVGSATVPIDPRFVDSQTYADIAGPDQVFGTEDDGPLGDYHLGLGSPAIDVGSNLFLDETDSDTSGPDAVIDLDGSGTLGDYMITIDLDGRPRVAETAVDIGAYEIVLDFGDAPLPYPTTAAEDGARHIVVGPMLGDSRDPETNATHSAADSDDTWGPVDDEDGVTFTSLLAPGMIATVEFITSGDGLLNGWIDFNGDGDWAETGEQIFVDESLGAGQNFRSLNVPLDAVITEQTFARFRISSSGGISYVGEAPDGEVEDHAVSIEPAELALTITSASVSENGGTMEGTISRNTSTVGDLLVVLQSSDPTEASVPATVMIPDGSISVSFTISIVDDALDDGDHTVTVTASAANFSGNTAQCAVLDDDTAAVTVNPTTALTTTESGGTAEFTIVLNSEPTADVTVTVSSGHMGEGIVAPPVLTFTPVTWNVAQMITVTGMDDEVDDGDTCYTIALAPAVSGDNNYSGLDPADVSVTNTNDDMAGITVTSMSGLTTTESGATADFTVALKSEPTAEVTITVTSNDETEGIISPVVLTFTPANWNLPQGVTITGVNDNIDDGDVMFTIRTDVTSADPTYDDMDVTAVTVTNTDDDTAGITVSPTSGLTTTEAKAVHGFEFTEFTVVLDSEPTSDVTIAVSSNDTTEGGPSLTSLVFTALNWRTPQIVIVNCVNDDVDDGDVEYVVSVGPVTGSDVNYNTIDPDDVSVTNLDDDNAGIYLVKWGPGDPMWGRMFTSESGSAARFYLQLISQPTSNVTIDIYSDDMTEGTVDPAPLVFTDANWNTPQIVTVTGVDDDLDDDNTAYVIVVAPAASSDANYDGLDPENIVVVNWDNDWAAVFVDPWSGMMTTEAGGTATFNIWLDSQPTADVTVAVSSDNTAEGLVSPAALVFTAENWNEPQTATVTGVDDHMDDGDVTFTILTEASSSDPNYNGREVVDATVTSIDDDTAGITVTPTSGAIMSEAGGTATFIVVLNSEPIDDVAITLSSSDASEGTVAPMTLTFTAANWGTMQMVTITGVDDDVDDGDITFTILTDVSSTDAIYNGMIVPGITVTNTDDDAAGITVNPMTGLATSESGDSAQFTVALESQPTSDVRIDLFSNNMAEGTVSPLVLVFTTENWAEPQTVTITGVGDDVDDGNVAYSVAVSSVASTDPNYSATDPVDVSLTNLDDDTAGIMVDSTGSLTTNEAGGTAEFTVRLSTEPIADVTVTVLSGDSTEGVLSPASLLFTSVNWNEAQAVTAAGVDDDVDDGDVTFAVLMDASSTDLLYHGLAISGVAVANVDDDTAGITVESTSGLVTTEVGKAASFSVWLNSEPTADVTIGLNSSDSSEGNVSPINLVFTAENWIVPQTVTVTGVDDALDDGDVAYTIVTVAAFSSDPNYNNLDAADVSVTNEDDERFVPVDLGRVDFRRLESLDPAAGELWFRMEAAHDGWLTILPVGVTIEPTLTMAVYDPSDRETPLAESSERIDHTVTESQICLLKVTGTASNVSFLVANLVYQQDSAVTVYGTDQADEFKFVGTAVRQVVINTVPYGYSAAELASVDFAGGDGRDTAWLYDSTGNENLEAWPDHAVLVNGPGDTEQDYTVQLSGIEDLLAYATSGGTDSAVFHGSEKADKLKSYEDSVRLRAGNSSYTLRAKKFGTIVGDAGSGGKDKDIAVFEGSEANDTFRYNGVGNSAQMEGKRRDHIASGFESVIVRAGDGTNDVAWLTDLAAADDVFYFKGHKTKLESESFDLTVRSFDEVHATAGQSGFDVARIYDTVGNDHLEASGDIACLYRRSGAELDLFYEAIGFDRVKAYCTEGDDTTDIGEHSFELLLDGWEE